MTMRLLEREVRMASITTWAAGPSCTTHASNFSFCRRAPEVDKSDSGSSLLGRRNRGRGGAEGMIHRRENVEKPYFRVPYRVWEGFFGLVLGYKRGRQE